MNKNRGIWIVIVSILVIGIFITQATSNFVKSKESLPESGGSADQSVVLSQDVPEEAGNYSGQPELFSLEQAPSTREVTQAETAAKKEESPIEDAGSSPESVEASFSVKSFDAPVSQAETEAVISPISPDTKNRSALLAVPVEGDGDYQKHLSELDAQIKKMWKESGDSNTYSMKALADKELKLWTIELNTIYNVVLERLGEEERSQLETSQQEWLKSRDGKAEEAADKYSGGSLEELEYTASLAESTRTRAYDLAAQYDEVLTPEKVR